MTERERWIIYPLLVIAVSYGIRDDLRRPPRIQAGRIECDEIVAQRVTGRSVRIVNQEEVLRASLGTNADGRYGEITTYTGNNDVMARVDTTEHGTRLLLFNDGGTEPREPIAKIDAFEAGSRLVLRDQSLEPRVALFGVDPAGVGVTYDQVGAVHPMLTVTVKPQPPAGADAPANPPDDPVPTLDRIPSPTSGKRRANAAPDEYGADESDADDGNADGVSESP